jgi:hypothetical protein
MNSPLLLQSSTETRGVSAPRSKHLRRCLPSTVTSRSTSKLDVASPSLPSLDPHRTQQHGPRRCCSPSPVQQCCASTSGFDARLERLSQIHPPWRPLTTGTFAGAYAWYVLTVWMWVSHDLFSFQVRARGGRALRGSSKPGTQPSPMAIVPPLHLRHARWYGSLPWTCTCSE